MNVISGNFKQKAEADEMVDAVLKAIYSFDGVTNMATAIGVLELCKLQIIEDSKE